MDGNGIICMVIGTVAFLTQLAEAVESCYFYHDDYNMYMSKYCDNGCCSDYGDDDEICCIDGTFGMIVGIAVAAAFVMIFVLFLVICCLHMKKRARVCQVVRYPGGSYPQNNTVVYASAPMHFGGGGGYGYSSYPPPSMYQQPTLPGQAPPTYAAATHPAYPPSMPFSRNNQHGNAQSHGHNGWHSSGNDDPSHPPPNPRNIYGGYGTGQG